MATQWLGAEFVLPCEFASQQPFYASDSRNIKRVVVTGPGQRWRFRGSLKWVSRELAAAILVHRATHGLGKQFDFPVPQLSGTWGPSVRVTGPIGATELKATGEGRVGAGRFIRLTNDNKLYMVTELRNQTGKLKIFPELRVAASNATVNMNPVMPATYDLDAPEGIEWSPNGKVKFTFSVIEVAN